MTVRWVCITAFVYSYIPTLFPLTFFRFLSGPGRVFRDLRRILNPDYVSILPRVEMFPKTSHQSNLTILIMSWPYLANTLSFQQL